VITQPPGVKTPGQTQPPPCGAVAKAALHFHDYCFLSGEPVTIHDGQKEVKLQMQKGRGYGLAAVLKGI
jgi:hypothetical protein